MRPGTQGPGRRPLPAILNATEPAIINISVRIAFRSSLLVPSACSREQTVHAANPPVEVQAIGNVQPFSSVRVKSRVAGQFVTVGFQEGQDVSKGDLPFTIDPRPLEAALKQAEAALAHDPVQATAAETDAARCSLWQSW